MKSIITKHCEKTESLLDEIYILIENWDTGSRKDPLDELAKHINKLHDLNESLKERAEI